MSWKGVKTLESNNGFTELFGIWAPLRFQPFWVLDGGSKFIFPFDPTWNWGINSLKKQKSNWFPLSSVGKFSAGSHTSSMFIFMLFAKPEKGKGGTNGIDSIIYSVVSPISKYSADRDAKFSQSNVISSPAETYGFPGIDAPIITWISAIFESQLL